MRPAASYCVTVTLSASRGPVSGVALRRVGAIAGDDRLAQAVAAPGRGDVARGGLDLAVGIVARDIDRAERIRHRDRAAKLVVTIDCGDVLIGRRRAEDTDP